MVLMAGGACLGSIYLAMSSGFLADLLSDGSMALQAKHGLGSLQGLVAASTVIFERCVRGIPGKQGALQALRAKRPRAEDVTSTVQKGETKPC